MTPELLHAFIALWLCCGALALYTSGPNDTPEEWGPIACTVAYASALVIFLSLGPVLWFIRAGYHMGLRDRNHKVDDDEPEQPV